MAYPGTNSFGGGLAGALVKNKKKKKSSGGKRPPGLSPEEWAQREAERYISAQVSSVEAERQAYLDELARQSQMRLEQGRRLAEALQSMNFPGRIQGLYSTVGNDVAGMAQGFSGNTRSIAATDAAEQLQMLSGTGQEGAVRNEGDAMGNVVYGVGGFLPGRALGETGAAFAADAAMQPGFALQDAAREAADLQSEGMAGLSDFTVALAKIRGEKPSLVQEMLDRRRGNIQDQRAWQLKVLEQERDWYIQQAALADRRGDSKRAEHYLKLAQQKEQRYIMQLQGYAPDGTLLPGYKIGKNGQVVKVPTSRSSSSKKSKGPDWGDIQKDIANDLADLTVEIDDPEDYHRPPRKIEVKMPYQQAFNTLMSRYSGLVKDRARLVALVKKILKANGFRPKSQGGGKVPGVTGPPPGSFSGDR